MKRSHELIVVGDLLLDRDLEGAVERLSPDAPVPVVEDVCAHERPGGAGLAALLAAGDGRDVTLVTGVADDAAGRRAVALLRAAGVTVLALEFAGSTPEKVRIRAHQRSLLRLDHGGAPGTVGPLTSAARRALRTAGAVLVSDYGRGVTAQPSLRAWLREAAPRIPVVWDPHPRGAQPVTGTRLVMPNLAETRAAVGGVLADLHAVTAAGRALLDRWQAAGVAVTMGAKGALLVSADATPLAVPCPERPVLTDPCGAGDRFAATAAGALCDGALVSEAVVRAVGTATAFVAGGGAASVRPPDAEGSSATGYETGGGAPLEPIAGLDAARALIAATRSRGGAAVATGGCFDLLHAGHVRMLAAARDLGDCLVVCLNSDDSVRRLKGPGRPVVSATDRAAVLAALASVDAVVLFDEDTPETVLTALQPDVWAKGADYTLDDLPEAKLLASWGGQAVVLPYLDGRSTTLILQEALHHDSS